MSGRRRRVGPIGLEAAVRALLFLQPFDRRGRDFAIGGLEGEHG